MSKGKGKAVTGRRVIKRVDQRRSIAEWIEAAHALADYKGWWDTAHDEPPNIPEKLALIHSEISEALEEYRNGHPVDARRTENGKPEGFSIELADALIRIFDLCGYYGIDLEGAVRIKHEYNATRPMRHGGKVC